MVKPGPLLVLVFIAANVLGFGVGKAVVSDEPRQVSAAPATVPVSTTTPVEEPPRRVLLAGDSVMAGLVPAVEAALEPTGAVEVDFLLTPSILRDPSVRFSWSQEIQERRPDVIVLFVGTWEARELTTAAGSVLTPEAADWATAYRVDVVEPWLDLVTSGGAEVVWIGAPSVGDSSLSDFFSLINQVFSEAAGDREGVKYLDPTPALGPSGSTFAATVDLPTGENVRLRQLDGLHLCPSGAQLLAELLLDELPVGGAVASGALDWQDGTWRGDANVYPSDACPS